MNWKNHHGANLSEAFYTQLAEVYPANTLKKDRKSTPVPLYRCLVEDQHLYDAPMSVMQSDDAEYVERSIEKINNSNVEGKFLNVYLNPVRHINHSSCYIYLYTLAFRLSHLHHLISVPDGDSTVVGENVAFSILHETYTEDERMMPTLREDLPQDPEVESQGASQTDSQG